MWVRYGSNGTLRRQSDEILLEVTRPVRHGTTETTAGAELERAFEISKFDTKTA